MQNAGKIPPTVLVIFGVSGDLSHRYLIPALATVARAGKLPEEFKVIGVSRQAINAKKLLGKNKKYLAKYTETFCGDLQNKQDSQRLKDRLAYFSKEFESSPQIIFYFAVPSEAVLPIVNALGEIGLNTPRAKLLMEKPFGVDLTSAKKLIQQTTKYFSEQQIYRIDHYLAKEMAQNITVFLGSNALFRNVWDSKFIEKIEIFSAEKIGIEGRTQLWESTGTLRDFVQSHLMQLAALVLMEPCSGVFEFQELPARRLAALSSIKPVDPTKAVHGQYEGYRREVGNVNSNADTFAYLDIESTNPRWRGVPIRLATGKCLDERLTEIRVHFKKTDDSQANRLILRVQPHEGIELDLWVKQPGYDHSLQKLPLKFAYDQYFAKLPNAYEQVLIDAMRGSHSLFASGDEVLASWSILDPILKSWSKDNKNLIIYKPGSSIEEIVAKQNF